MNCTSTSNTGNGIKLEGRSFAIGNTCASNGSSGTGSGILSSGNDDRIEGNNVATNDRGIEVTGTGCLIIRNSVSGNTTNNYEIAASNRYGPIINITAGGAAAASGNSAVSTVNSTDPWANFAY
jgi:parallel beta-helix repeat protein